MCVWEVRYDHHTTVWCYDGPGRFIMSGYDGPGGCKNSEKKNNTDELPHGRCSGRTPLLCPCDRSLFLLFLLGAPLLDAFGRSTLVFLDVFVF